MSEIVVIGSGIGGLGCAAALARQGRRVLVLEQHNVAGGLTHTFSRGEYTWDVGVHYLGKMGPQQQVGRLLAWLTDGRLQMAPLGPIYDTVRFPGGFEFAFSRPADALRHDLLEAFPESSADIARFLAAFEQARRANELPFQLHSVPKPLVPLIALLGRKRLRGWWSRTTREVLSELVRDPKLRAVLSAQWQDHGGKPSEASFGMHALIMDHYLDGAYYPVGGARAFAEALVPTIEAAGGEVRLNAPVARILVERGSAVGVELEDGTRIAARRVVSDTGVHNTVGRLLPEPMRDSPWARELLALRPSLCHLALYLGFEGDIRAAGASRSNVWIYETWDVENAVCDDPFTQADAPALFVSFPSLKDPRHAAGGGNSHTGEVIVWTSWDLFAPWEQSRYGGRPEDYAAFKAALERNLLAQFSRHFPALAPMIRISELSTPLSAAHFTRAHRGAVYGLETTPRRFLSRALHVKTPVPGLYLSGQDPVSPGIAGALAGGVLAAANIDPRIFRRLSR